MLEVTCMAREKICGIYCIRNIVNDKRYIGQSIDVFNRRASHYCALKQGKHSNDKLQNAWNKYKEENFEFYVIVKCDKDKLDELERYYVEMYDSYKHGYNKTPGGQDYFAMDEIRKDPYASVRENMRFAHDSRPIYQIDLTGCIVKKWYGAREASKKLNINQAAIWQCLHHERLTLYNYIWIFVDEFDEFDLSKYLNHNTQSRKIIQKNLDGEIIKIWNSASSARSYGFDSSCIIKCCKGKITHYKNFLWSYYDDIC
jgi:hypothetical protein